MLQTHLFFFFRSTWYYWPDSDKERWMTSSAQPDSTQCLVWVCMNDAWHVSGAYMCADVLLRSGLLRIFSVLSLLIRWSLMLRVCAVSVFLGLPREISQSIFGSGFSFLLACKTICSQSLVWSVSASPNHKHDMWELDPRTVRLAPDSDEIINRKGILLRYFRRIDHPPDSD